MEGKKELREISVLLREFNQREKITLNVAEIFFHPNFSPHENNRESNSAIVITKNKIPFNYFIFTTCFREFLLSKGTTISHIIEDSLCQLSNFDSKNHKFFEMHFPKSKSGALYVQFKDQSFLIGFFAEDIIESKVCETKKFESLEEIHHFFQCEKRSITTVAGSKASENFCYEEVIFQDDFETLDKEVWKHENTLRGGGNWEFQWYVPDQENSFVKDGILHIKPTFTNDKMGKNFVKKKIATIPSADCTDSADFGCRRNSRHGTINPIRSASISTKNSFCFKYGIVEIRAKVAAGDWLASTISLLPKDQTFYGRWPHSGEVDVLESRGNRNLILDDENIGVEKIGSTFQFGTTLDNAHSEINKNISFGEDFHVYKFVWTPDEMTTFVDDSLVHQMKIQNEGLWEQFNLGTDQKIENPWKKGSSNAPFDKEFFISINLKVGGVRFFPDEAINFPPKPWNNVDGHAATDFWDRVEDWNSTWIDDDVDFQIDYVKVTAL